MGKDALFPLESTDPPDQLSRLIHPTIRSGSSKLSVQANFPRNRSRSRKVFIQNNPKLTFTKTPLSPVEQLPGPLSEYESEIVFPTSDNISCKSTLPGNSEGYFDLVNSQIHGGSKALKLNTTAQSVPNVKDSSRKCVNGSIGSAKTSRRNLGDYMELSKSQANGISNDVKSTLNRDGNITKRNVNHFYNNDLEPSTFDRNIPPLAFSSDVSDESNSQSESLITASSSLKDRHPWLLKSMNPPECDYCTTPGNYCQIHTLEVFELISMRMFGIADDLQPARDFRTGRSNCVKDVKSLSAPPITNAQTISPYPNQSKPVAKRDASGESMTPKNYKPPVESEIDVNNRCIAKWDSIMLTTKQSTISSRSIGSDLSNKIGMKSMRCSQSGQDISCLQHISRFGKNLPDYFKIVQLTKQHGIPQKYRNILWLELSGANNKLVPGEFQRLLFLSEIQAQGDIRAHIGQINLDLHRTFSTNVLFHDVGHSAPGPFFHMMRNLLYAFAAYNPSIGYAQGMNFIAGNILLAVHESSIVTKFNFSEEEVFWIFVSVVEELSPKYKHILFFEKSALPFIQKDVNSTVAVHLAAAHAPLYHHLVQLRVELEIIVLGWWLSAFCEIFSSSDTWCIVVDGLLIADNSNHKFMIYSLAILVMNERALMSLDTAEDVYLFFQGLKDGSAPQTGKSKFAQACRLIESSLSTLAKV